MNKKGKNRKGVMYSTNRDFEYEYVNEEMETLPNNEQTLKYVLTNTERGKLQLLLKNLSEPQKI